MFFLQKDFTIDRFPALHGLAEGLIIRAPCGSGQQVPEIDAKKLFSITLEKLLRAGVCVNQPPVAIEGDERIGDAFHHIREWCLGCSRRRWRNRSFPGCLGGQNAEKNRDTGELASSVPQRGGAILNRDAGAIPGRQPDGALTDWMGRCGELNHRWFTTGMEDAENLMQRASHDMILSPTGDARSRRIHESNDAREIRRNHAVSQ